MHGIMAPSVVGGVFVVVVAAVLVVAVTVVLVFVA